MFENDIGVTKLIHWKGLMLILYMYKVRGGAGLEIQVLRFNPILNTSYTLLVVVSR